MSKPSAVPDRPGGGATAHDLPSSRTRAELVIQNARVLPSPELPPVERATVLIGDGRILVVEPDARIPPNAQVIPGEGRVVTAGFWNAHVHFTEAKWRAPARRAAVVLDAHLHDMFTSRGFTTVVDLGSDPRVTLTLRRRIDSGQVLGPSIYTAGTGIYPPKGIPYYLRESLPFWYRPFLPQPSTARAARWVVRRNLARGADLVKLFTGSYVARGTVRTMPEPIARSAVESAHAAGRLAFSHPSNLEGTRVALHSGVDVLAHPPDATQGIDASVLGAMVDHRMVMIPTLKMFADTVSPDASYLEPIYDVVRRFRSLGGELLFGTDVGYMTDHTTEDEFLALSRCGLEGVEVLRMLTTGPAGRFGVGGSVGTVVPGARANLTVLDADPREHPLAFTRVRATIRDGRVLHLRP